MRVRPVGSRTQDRRRTQVIQYCSNACVWYSAINFSLELRVALPITHSLNRPRGELSHFLHVPVSCRPPYYCEVCLALWASLSLSCCLENERAQRAYVVLVQACSLRQSVRLVLGGSARALPYYTVKVTSCPLASSSFKQYIIPHLPAANLRTHIKYRLSQHQQGSKQFTPVTPQTSYIP